MRFAILIALASFRLHSQDPTLDRTPAPGFEWQLRYFHDEDGSTLRLTDFQISSNTCMAAFGSLHDNRAAKVTGAVVRSTDGGSTWVLTQTKEVPRTGFLLGPKLGWMVTEGGVWRTGDCGSTWEKVSHQEGLIRTWFLDEQHGVAAGFSKRALETSDGGRTWKKIAGLSDISSAEDRSLFHWIDFAGSKFGMIVGAHEPRRPAETARRRQTPSLLLTLQTIDGGQTWKGSTASILGRVTRVRLSPNGSGLLVVEFQDEFEWPGEVYRLDPAGNAMVRVFREQDRAVKDAITLRNGASYVAAIEPPGSDWRMPVPGKVRIARSMDGQTWQEMHVDYRAVAGRVMFAAHPAGPIVAATDSGMILSLARK